MRMIEIISLKGINLKIILTLKNEAKRANKELKKTCQKAYEKLWMLNKGGI